MIGIVVALGSEAKTILEKITDKEELKLFGKKVIKGKISDKEVVLAISGIGKVSASLSTQALIDIFSPDYIINAGTCGGTDASVKVKSFYAVEKTFQFDFDVTEIDDVKIGYIQEYNTVFFSANTNPAHFLPKANLATADRFSSNKNDIDLIRKNGCSIRDMEGCAIAQVCVSNSVPFIAIKGVTDVYGSGNDGSQFYENLTSVCSEIGNFVEKVINNL